MIYTGIGSRQTPSHVLESMFLIGAQLAESGWTLRSGHADGADLAFEEGCLSANGAMEIFVPWYGFNAAPNNDNRYIRPKATQELADFAAQYHPAWNKCSDAAKLLHMRNVYQVLGEEQNSTMVICWTPYGKGGGGTGMAIHIAQEYGIPVFDLAIKGIAEQLCEFVYLAENPR